MCWRGQHSPAHRDTEVAAGFKGLLGVDLASEEHLVDEHLHKIEQRLLHLGARGHTRAAGVLFFALSHKEFFANGSKCNGEKHR